MKDIIAKHKTGERIGICSVCSAHPLVIEAALREDLHTGRKVLIEATSNQVNQFGGYTGMLPIDFRDFVLAIAEKIGFPLQRLILGGDHLGPNCWQHENAETAMAKAQELIARYVEAGFSKIHLDASMSCADDPVPLDPFVVAQRAARLCQVAEEVATAQQKALLTYVIGTEVPVPGGESSAIQHVHVTEAKDAKATLDMHHQAFRELGLNDAIDRIVAIVVQPGVEFDHSRVIHYQSDLAQDLSAYIATTPLVYEAHSTDYQTRDSYRNLVKDHFAILKVGPALTFALREAVFALANIEQVLIAPECRSQILTVIDGVMLDEPGYWKKYYNPTFSLSLIDLHFSLSDRIRYYWPHTRINRAMDVLMANLRSTDIPLGLLSQYLPAQFERVMNGELASDPHELIIDKIQDVLRAYHFGCTPLQTTCEGACHA
ncbi:MULTISPECIES: tagatose-bisphosphate aldolase subunit GatZ [Rahnella]|uniref:Tagatose-bisphosphate aldolase subunit GatZ n=1 Tax=Rahnella sp. (strain Y9602) TaxID=2703885 RepID=A0ABW6C4I7_RAHSY|nr:MULTISPECIES: tagatose-bisphosphate aldolase subunit GatZ [Rahnella]AYA08252.1 tagatose-bisphosphate aldolase subunit GatZ [Rahnella aquatilis]AZP43477.1 tagatose-bisphosphate aldolase subunit GatZ [Rahnella aquatilis]AZP47815.1 tagatose-bisphosphate aldolase subunit GatZ [Rahnella aquatilis]AZP52261.1 tagatose-bisphosphate aldolase subunit GatZ [Rahnella aquatilis]MBU9841903.1 tagatose-bisphosphate aldolase subunit GatZ [Rahnella aceris]